MKKLSLIDKIIFVVNSLVASVSLLSYLLPYIPPSGFPLLSVLSLALPVLLAVNVLFLVYWLIRFKKQLLLSLFVLVLGISHLKALVEFAHKPLPEEPEDISIMTYNVRMFNRFDWKKRLGINDSISKLIETESPDIVFFQEFWKTEYPVYKAMYPYNYKAYIKKMAKKSDGTERLVETKFGQAIFSKYEIVNSGEFNFQNTGNNIIYADIKIKGEVVRVYNVHLQSTKVNSELETEGIAEANKEKIARNISKSFVIQESQMESLIAHIQKFEGRVIVAGDFNNTAYSYVYKVLKNTFDLVDSFEEKGSGFGRTFEFKYFPMRIDFVLADKSFAVKCHTNYKQHYSDHYPVKVVLGLHTED